MGERASASGGTADNLAGRDGVESGMDLRIIEATDGFSHGTFGVGRHTVGQWARTSALPGLQNRRLLDHCVWTYQHVWVLDLQTGEGAMFRPGGLASADLNAHRIHVCPLFEPFLEWLYDDYVMAPRREGWWSSLPEMARLPQPPGAVYGRRRKGVA